MFILVVFSFILHVVLPIVLMGWLVFGKAPSVAHYMFRALFAIVYVLQIAVAGAGWTWFGFWLRYVMMAGVVLCTLAGAALVIRRKLSVLELVTWRERIDLLLAVGLFAVFATGLPTLAGRRQYQGVATELLFPLRGDNFVPVHAGEGALVNAHADVKAQKYALDIVQLGRYGMRAQGFLPSELERYMIYGRAVSAPCSGEVIAARDDRPNQAPPDGDTQHLAGNFAVIFCKDLSVLLAHLKPGSLKVRVGDRVAMGAPIGEVGNSGNTSEPHLHIHAVKGRVADEQGITSDAEAVPLLFPALTRGPASRFLTRNDRVSND
jgi:hypothetical protein